MAKHAFEKADIPAFRGLPVRRLCLGGGLDVAVHLCGDWSGRALPIVCVPGYVRNMADFTQFKTLMQRQLDADWPMALIDLPGRGRSSWRRNPDDYTTLADADTLAKLASGLALSKAIFVGMGHGGQVLMALGCQRPEIMAGVVLIDAGPVTDPRGLVRLRNNLAHVTASRSEAQAEAALQQILAADYPALEPAALDALAARYFLAKGRRRPLPLFDPALAERLKAFSADDVFEPQWALFNTLDTSELMLVRSQFTDRLRRDTFDEMARQRLDAVTISIEGQGSPALLDGADETGAIADFIRFVQKRRG